MHALPVSFLGRGAPLPVAELVCRAPGAARGRAGLQHTGAWKGGNDGQAWGCDWVYMTQALQSALPSCSSLSTDCGARGQPERSALGTAFHALAPGPGKAQHAGGFYCALKFDSAQAEGLKALPKKGPNGPKASLETFVRVAEMWQWSWDRGATTLSPYLTEEA